MGAGSASTTRTTMPQLPSIAVTLVSPKPPISSWVRSIPSASPGFVTRTAQSSRSPNFSTWGLQPSATFRTFSLKEGPSAPFTRMRATSGFWMTEATRPPSLNTPLRTVSSPMVPTPAPIAAEWYHRNREVAGFLSPDSFGVPGSPRDGFRAEEAAARFPRHHSLPFEVFARLPGHLRGDPGGGEGGERRLHLHDGSSPEGRSGP